VVAKYPDYTPRAVVAIREEAPMLSAAASRILLLPVMMTAFEF
jgi:hypothetical protein